MNKIGVIYFSGTGNTKFVAQNIKAELERYRKDVDLINIEKDRINPNDYESLIIGGPIYVERYPDILLEYVEKYLKEFNGNCMLFTTQGAKKESFAFQHFINRLPFINVIYCMFIPMPNNFYNFMFEMSSKQEENQLIKESSLLIKKEIKDFFNGKIKVYPKSNFNVTMIDKAYKIFYNYYKSFLTKKINIDMNKCNNCKLCENSCPVDCIKIEDNANFNKDCILCQRCMSRCPNKAFLYKNKPFIQYNPNFKYIGGALNEKR